MQQYLYFIIVASLLVLNGTAFIGVYGALHPPKSLYTLSPRVYLAEMCLEKGCEFALLDSIVWCESKWKMVSNGTSSAHGYFQILDGTEATTPQYAEGKTKYDPYHNVEMGVFLWERDGVNPWRESEGCWQWRYRGEPYTEENKCIGAGCEA